MGKFKKMYEDMIGQSLDDSFIQLNESKEVITERLGDRMVGLFDEYMLMECKSNALGYVNVEEYLEESELAEGYNDVVRELFCEDAIRWFKKVGGWNLLLEVYEVDWPWPDLRVKGYKKEAPYKVDGGTYKYYPDYDERLDDWVESLGDDIVLLIKKRDFVVKEMRKLKKAEQDEIENLSQGGKANWALLAFDDKTKYVHNGRSKFTLKQVSELDTILKSKSDEYMGSKVDIKEDPSVSLKGERAYRIYIVKKDGSREKYETEKGMSVFTLSQAQGLYDNVKDDIAEYSRGYRIVPDEKAPKGSTEIKELKYMVNQVYKRLEDRIKYLRIINCEKVLNDPDASKAKKAKAKAKISKLRNSINSSDTQWKVRSLKDKQLPSETRQERMKRAYWSTALEVNMADKTFQYEEPDENDELIVKTDTMSTGDVDWYTKWVDSLDKMKNVVKRNIVDLWVTRQKKIKLEKAIKTAFSQVKKDWNYNIYDDIKNQLDNAKSKVETHNKTLFDLNDDKYDTPENEWLKSDNAKIYQQALLDRAKAVFNVNSLKAQLKPINDLDVPNTNKVIELWRNMKSVLNDKEAELISSIKQYTPDYPLDNDSIKKQAHQLITKDEFIRSMKTDKNEMVEILKRMSVPSIKYNPINPETGEKRGISKEARVLDNPSASKLEIAKAKYNLILKEIERLTKKAYNLHKRSLTPDVDSEDEVEMLQDIIKQRKQYVNDSKNILATVRRIKDEKSSDPVEFESAKRVIISMKNDRENMLDVDDDVIEMLNNEANGHADHIMDLKSDFKKRLKKAGNAGLSQSEHEEHEETIEEYEDRIQTKIQLINVLGGEFTREERPDTSDDILDYPMLAADDIRKISNMSEDIREQFKNLRNDYERYIREEDWKRANETVNKVNDLIDLTFSERTIIGKNYRKQVLSKTGSIEKTLMDDEGVLGLVNVKWDKLKAEHDDAVEIAKNVYEKRNKLVGLGDSIKRFGIAEENKLDTEFNTQRKLMHKVLSAISRGKMTAELQNDLWDKLAKKEKELKKTEDKNPIAYQNIHYMKRQVHLKVGTEKTREKTVDRLASGALKELTGKKWATNDKNLKTILNFIRNPENPNEPLLPGDTEKSTYKMTNKEYNRRFHLVVKKNRKAVGKSVFSEFLTTEGTNAVVEYIQANQVYASTLGTTRFVDEDSIAPIDRHVNNAWGVLFQNFNKWIDYISTTKYNGNKKDLGDSSVTKSSLRQIGVRSIIECVIKFDTTRDKDFERFFSSAVSNNIDNEIRRAITGQTTSIGGTLIDVDGEIIEMDEATVKYMEELLSRKVFIDNINKIQGQLDDHMTEFQDILSQVGSEDDDDPIVLSKKAKKEIQNVIKNLYQADEELTNVQIDIDYLNTIHGAIPKDEWPDELIQKFKGIEADMEAAQDRFDKYKDSVDRLRRNYTNIDRLVEKSKEIGRLKSMLTIEKLSRDASTKIINQIRGENPYTDGEGKIKKKLELDRAINAFDQGSGQMYNFVYNPDTSGQISTSEKRNKKLERDGVRLLLNTLSDMEGEKSEAKDKNGRIEWVKSFAHAMLIKAWWGIDAKKMTPENLLNPKELRKAFFPKISEEEKNKYELDLSKSLSLKIAKRRIGLKLLDLQHIENIWKTKQKKTWEGYKDIVLAAIDHIWRPKKYDDESRRELKKKNMYYITPSAKSEHRNMPNGPGLAAFDRIPRSEEELKEWYDEDHKFSVSPSVQHDTLALRNLTKAKLNELKSEVHKLYTIVKSQRNAKFLAMAELAGERAKENVANNEEYVPDSIFTNVGGGTIVTLENALDRAYVALAARMKLKRPNLYEKLRDYFDDGEEGSISERLLAAIDAETDRIRKVQLETAKIKEQEAKAASSESSVPAVSNAMKDHTKRRKSKKRKYKATKYRGK